MKANELRKVADDVNENALGPILDKIDQAMNIETQLGKYSYQTPSIYDSYRGELIADYYQRQGFITNWHYSSDTNTHCYVSIKW